MRLLVVSLLVLALAAAPARAAAATPPVGHVFVVLLENKNYVETFGANSKARYFSGTLARSGQLYTCNGTTEAFLDKVDGARSFDQIVGLLSQEFEVDKATLDQDIAALATDLVAEGILADPVA